MRIIIAASGPQTKWGGHLGVPSHLAPVDGRPLLARTVAQALTYTRDVRVTVPPGDTRYVDAASGARAHERSTEHPSEYAATRDLWHPGERTVLLLGDVYFTDDALDTITRFDDRQDYQVFGRRGASKITGTPYGEIFAVSWWPQQHRYMDRYLATVHQARASGRVARPPGWMLLRAWQGSRLDQHRVMPRYFTEIHDATDDFDFPADYDQHPAIRREVSA